MKISDLIGYLHCFSAQRKLSRPSHGSSEKGAFFPAQLERP